MMCCPRDERGDFFYAAAQTQTPCIILYVGCVYNKCLSLRLVVLLLGHSVVVVAVVVPCIAMLPPVDQGMMILAAREEGRREGGEVDAGVRYWRQVCM